MSLASSSNVICSVLSRWPTQCVPLSVLDSLLAQNLFNVCVCMCMAPKQGLIHVISQAAQLTAYSMLVPLNRASFKAIKSIIY